MTPLDLFISMGILFVGVPLVVDQAPSFTTEGIRAEVVIVVPLVQGEYIDANFLFT